MHRVFEPKGFNVKRYSNNEEIYMDLQPVAWRDFCRHHSVERLPVDAARQGLCVVGPELKDPKYVGEGAGIAVRKVILSWSAS